jgi:peptide/nickel transport system substrate-binding protein
MYETLTLLDPVTGQALPCISDTWSHSPDAKAWTFHIRSGVTFHDALNVTYGTVTAADVKYTIDCVKDYPKSVVGPASAMQALINNVTVVDNYTVTVYLKSPDPLFDTSYMCQGNPVWIISKSYIESKGNSTANAKPVGTGPYVLINHSPGDSITLEVVANHWRVTSPDFSYIQFKSVPEEATRVAKLESGECDLAPIAYDSIAGVQSAGLHILSIPGTWAPYMVLGGTCPARPARWNPANPWADNRVRLALNYAVNKTAIVNSIFHGSGGATVCGAQSYVPAWYNITDWVPYDPATAASLLADAGYPDGFNVTIKEYTHTPGAEMPIISQAVANYWRAINITVTEYSVAYSTVRTEWTTDNATTYIFPHRGMCMTDSIQAIKAAFDKDSTFVVYCDNDTEALKALILASSDPVYRNNQAYNFGLLLKEKVAFVPICFANEPYGASARVGNWPSLSVTILNIYQITRP